MIIPEEDSSPLATVDDIHRRLLRPPFLNSSSSTEDAGGRGSSRFMKTNSIQLRETTKRKLEDYLDPVLLRAISSEIGGRMKKNHEITKSKRREIKDDFEWPIDELKVLVEDYRTEKRNNEAAVNLDDDIHLSQIQEVDADDGVGNREGEFCTPFQRFEHTALRKFNG